MDLQKLTIGQMAKLNRISQQTLRLYDREGLLTPMITDSHTGYRYYHIIQSARLDMIQYMKASGMTLKQIRQQLDEGDSETIQRFLAQQQDAIDRQIEDLIRSKRSISRTLENYRQYKALPKDGQMFMEYIPQRYIYRYTSEKDFFDQDYAGYEYMLRELKMHLDNNDLSMSYFCNVGTIMRQENLLEENFSANDVFLFVDPEDDMVAAEIIPAAMYYCVCSDDFYAEKSNARNLLRLIRDSGFEVCGDYLCEVLVEFPVFENDQRNMFYKIEIPVIPKKSQKNP
ncbi:helix-turn-helix domain-containing protein [Anaerovorax odorimutans]|uniref:Helix-turn-helix domain-containing protein n=1 Tax=Anaerovorax odorimutans TaxID=109327 RepID=A0ABT1RM12_9FIRM|nr:helix-turn-helix domain-containing protein [Anaerovorax odorimutans]MCQ4636217.1 helix-turn-helix domain-containing protein [Anaerovorax odorimutans]